MNEKNKKISLLTRKVFLKEALFAPMAFGIIFLQNCKTKQAAATKAQDSAGNNLGSTSFQANSSPVVSPESKGLVSNINPVASDPAADCDKPFKITNLEVIPEEIKQNFETEIKFFGVPKIATIVIALPKFVQVNTGILKSLVLVRSDGSPLLQRGIQSISDFKDNQTLKYLVFENINLEFEKSVTILFEKYDSSVSKRTFIAPISFEETFNGKTVYHYRPDGLYHFVSENMIFPKIIPDLNPGVDSSPGYYEKDSYYIATKDAAFTTKGLEEVVVTDLFGKILSNIGETFTNFYEYPEVWIYKPVGDIYLRMMIRL